MQPLIRMHTRCPIQVSKLENVPSNWKFRKDKLNSSWMMYSEEVIPAVVLRLEMEGCLS